MFTGSEDGTRELGLDVQQQRASNSDPQNETGAHRQVLAVLWGLQFPAGCCP